jgi:hypothetical protein
MSYDNLSSVSQNVLKFYQQLTGEERRIPFIFDDFHFLYILVSSAHSNTSFYWNIILEQTDWEFGKPKTINLVFAASLLSMKN